MSLGGAVRVRVLAGTVLVLTFVAGGLGGALVFRELHDRERDARAAMERRRDECPPQRTAEDRRRRTLRPYDDIGLTDEQANRIVAILEADRPKVDAVARNARQPVDSVIEQTRAKIREILTPEQRVVMDQRRRERMQRDSVRREEWRQRCGIQNGTQGSQSGGPQPRDR